MEVQEAEDRKAMEAVRAGGGQGLACRFSTALGAGTPLRLTL